MGSHIVHNFVDDSSSLICSKDEIKLQNDLVKYTKLMKIFYSANILKINQSKTVMMIVPKTKSCVNWSETKIKVDDGVIKTSESMKMLGGYLNDAINNLVSTLANIEVSLKRLNFISDMRICLQMAN